MLTPIEIQGITFKTGRGYKKDDVDSFMKALYHDYEVMYKENQELKEKINTLSDGVQYYKNLEKTLQKALVLAEKTSEETKEAAKKQAETVEKEARLTAEKLLLEAKQECNKIEAKTKDLMQNFELYKTQFRQIAKAQLELLDSESFTIQKKELNFNFQEEEPEPDKLDAGLEKALEPDKTEVTATEEEKLQEERLAKQVAFESERQAEERKEAEEKHSIAEPEEKHSVIEKEKAISPEMKNHDEEKEEIQASLDEEDFRVNLDGILEEPVQEKPKEGKPAKLEERIKADTETELEIKMLQKLLHEIKKNKEPTADEEGFEFINTESDD